MCTFSKGKKGFSLIELMVVIAIIAVMAGASFLSFSSLTGSRLESDARKMVANLCWARQMAVAKHEDYIVVFDLVNSRYTIYRISIAPNNQVKVMNLTASIVSVLPAPNQVTFLFPRGIPTAAARQDITLNYQGKAKVISVYANTGYVKIQ